MGRFETVTVPSMRSALRAAGLGGFVVLTVLAVGCGDPPDQHEPDSRWTIGEPDAGPGDTVERKETEPPPEDTGGTTAQRVAGQPCRSASQCAGDVCMPDESFPDGYCTRLNCNGNGDCTGADGICVQFQGGSTGCLAECSNHDDCRDGYACQVTDGGGSTACLPGDPSPPMTFEETRQVLDVSCRPRSEGRASGGRTRYAFDFSIGEDVNAFLMVPYVTEGTVQAVELQAPDATVDLANEYRHHNARLSDLENDQDLSGVGTFGEVAFGWPVQVPYAPQYSDYLVSGGDYTLEVLSDRERPCLYVLENRPGTTLDLNFYFVGANGLDAAAAKSDTDLAEAVEELDRIYRKAGVEIGKIRYRDVSDEVEAKYRRITSYRDAHELTAHGEPSTAALPGHLSIDVFLVDALDLERSGSGNIVGMSSGMPGAAGLHGHPRNGLVFQTTDLGSDNQHVGHIMAHEIGHFLGLRHTTETLHGTDRGETIDDLFGTTDPIRDTPVCENILEKVRRDPYRCADRTNLMFPVAPPPREDLDPDLSGGQGQAMRWNPLIH